MSEQTADQLRGGEVSERLLLTGALATTLVMWASAFVVIRSVGPHLSPGSLALTRIAVGAVALSVAMIVRRQRLPARAALPGTLASGVLWFGGYMFLLNMGERWVDAGTSSLLVNTGPIFIALLAGRFLDDVIPRSLLAGCFVALLGVALIAAGASGHGSHELRGALLCLAAAVCYSAAVVAQKPALSHSAALPVTWLACVTGTVALLGFAPQTAHQLAHASAGTIIGAIYLGVGPTAVAFLLWAYVLSHMDASRLGASTYAVPPMVVLISWVALDQVPPLIALPGGLLCLAGVAITRRR
jgi:drug/metabolite transporter (DMT)-like permease